MADVMRLQVETGAVTVEVEDEKGQVIGAFEFTPTDSGILGRYGKVAAFFENMTVDESLPDEQRVAQMAKLADDIAGQIDYLLGAGAAQGLFAKCGPLTVTKNGDFFFEKVLEGVGSIIEKTTKTRLNKKMARIKRATARYEK